MIPRPRHALLVTLPMLILAGACGGNSTPAPSRQAAPEPSPTNAEAAPEAQIPTDSEADPSVVAPASTGAANDIDAIPMAAPPPIPPAPTPEELKMLDIDPKDLSPEDRRKRAKIRYRQIMQDPDSPQARVIRQAQAQMMSQVPPGAGPAQDKSGMVLHAPADSYPTPSPAGEAAANMEAN